VVADNIFSVFGGVASCFIKMRGYSAARERFCMLRKSLFGTRSLLRTMALLVGIVLVFGLVGCGGDGSPTGNGGTGGTGGTGGGGDSNWTPLSSWSVVPAGTWVGSGSYTSSEDGMTMTFEITSWILTVGLSGPTGSSEMKGKVTFGGMANDEWQMVKTFMGEAMFKNPGYNDTAHSISGTFKDDAVGGGTTGGSSNDTSGWEINQAKNRLRCEMERNQYIIFNKR